MSSFLSSPTLDRNFLLNVVRERGVWKEIGRTECIIGNQAPLFEEGVYLEYNFSENYKLNFVVYKINPKEIINSSNKDINISKGYKLGETTVNLHELVAKPQFTAKLNTKNLMVEKVKPSIHIRTTKADPINDDVINFRIGSKVKV